MGDSDAQNM